MENPLKRNRFQAENILKENFPYLQDLEEPSEYSQDSSKKSKVYAVASTGISAVPSLKWLADFEHVDSKVLSEGGYTFWRGPGYGLTPYPHEGTDLTNRCQPGEICRPVVVPDLSPVDNALHYVNTLKIDLPDPLPDITPFRVLAVGLAVLAGLAVYKYQSWKMNRELKKATKE